MSDPPPGSVSDPVVSRLLEWRRHPTAEATLTLCADLEARPSIDLVALVAKVVAKLHWDAVDVVRALARLQVRAGLHSQGRRTMLRAAKLEVLGKPQRIVVDTRCAPDRAATHEHPPPQLLLDLLRGLDDDDAIETVARQVTPRPSQSRRSSTQRLAALAALGGLSRTLDRVERRPVDPNLVAESSRPASSSPPPPAPASG